MTATVQSEIHDEATLAEAELSNYDSATIAYSSAPGNAARSH